MAVVVRNLAWALVAGLVVPTIIVTATAAIVAVLPAHHDDTRKYRLAILQALISMLHALTPRGRSPQDPPVPGRDHEQGTSSTPSELDLPISQDPSPIGSEDPLDQTGALSALIERGHIGTKVVKVRRERPTGDQ